MVAGSPGIPIKAAVMFEFDGAVNVLACHASPLENLKPGHCRFCRLHFNNLGALHPTNALLVDIEGFVTGIDFLHHDGEHLFVVSTDSGPWDCDANQAQISLYRFRSPYFTLLAKSKLSSTRPRKVKLSDFEGKLKVLVAAEDGLTTHEILSDDLRGPYEFRTVGQIIPANGDFDVRAAVPDNSLITFAANVNDRSTEISLYNQDGFALAERFATSPVLQAFDVFPSAFGTKLVSVERNYQPNIKIPLVQVVHVMRDTEGYRKAAEIQIYLRELPDTHNLRHPVDAKGFSITNDVTYLAIAVDGTSISIHQLLGEHLLLYS
ncbi:unnamed protein product [Notodromas monacha]|uniref:Uncharacterized protein n=1 Tax=Notodromas monacha TaxID=399045 RepID=A0A7R9BXN7_9CRUS|nr:unnamed protein product [Notodromas monacha]CAG0923627.1 unnamed protein product [Notodromas monacha]